MIYDIDSFPGVKSFTRSMITYTGADTLSPKKGYNVDNFTYSDKGKIFERNKYENVRYADDTWDSVLYAKDGSWQTHLWYANFMGTEQVRSETYVYNEEKKPVKKHVELSVDGWVESESFLYDAKGVLTKACDTSTIDTTVVYYAYDKKGRCVSVRTIARTFLNIDSTVYSNDGALLKNIKLLTQHVFFDGKFRGDRFNYDSTIYTRKDGLVIQKDRYATGYGHRISTYEYDAQQRMIHSGTVSDAQASSNYETRDDYEYDDHGNVIKHKSFQFGESFSESWRIQYSKDGLPLRCVSNLDENGMNIYTWTYEFF